MSKPCKSLNKTGCSMFTWMKIVTVGVFAIVVFMLLQSMLGRVVLHALGMYEPELFGRFQYVLNSLAGLTMSGLFVIFIACAVAVGSAFDKNG